MSLAAPAGTTDFIAEYIWISGKNTHKDIRGKTRVLRGPLPPLDASALTNLSPAELTPFFPQWSFDGSSTDQAKGENTEIIIEAVRAFLHPFPRSGADVSMRLNRFLVLCQCFTPDGKDFTPCNTRCLADDVFAPHRGLEPWFAFEQEYVILDRKTGRPYMWPENGFPAPQGPYYCSYGATAWGRDVAEEHLERCLAAGVRLSGINAEVLPGQWEYQVGPNVGIAAGDHAVVARWILLRVAEDKGLDIAFESKPVKGDWNGSGMHTNYSTAPMRTANGLKVIVESCERLRATHMKEVAVYGTDNNERLSGKHETSNWRTFAFGFGTRHTSIRIPVQCQNTGCGYFEDRRPSSSADPYLVSSRLFASSNGFAAPKLDAFGEAHRPVWQL